MNQFTKYRWHEQGATAIIIVVFTVLLLVTMSVGFIRLVVQDQVRTSDNEMARGAYDSAMAGVEDGKRVLEACRQDQTSSACAAITDQKCTTTVDAGFVGLESGEVRLKSQSGSAGDSFNQAYTCVKVFPDTEDFLGRISNDSSKVIPLVTTSNLSSIEVSWYQNEAVHSTGEMGLSGGSTDFALPTLGGWGVKKPPILRLQFISYNKDSYDPANMDTANGMNTIMLYPKSGVGGSAMLSGDSRLNGSNVLQNGRCQQDGTSSYLCKATVSLPRVIAAYADPGYAGYLRVSAYYVQGAGTVDFSVRLLGGAKFFAVQPIVDSTGRAGDIFRRVQARVERIDLDEQNIYPRAAVDLSGDFCKKFYVIGSPGAVNQATGCTSGWLE